MLIINIYITIKGDEKLKCSALTLYCKKMGLLEDGGECEKLLHAVINDVLLGVIQTKELKDTELLLKASMGLLHAVAVASKLAGLYGYHVFLSALDSAYSGVVVVANPPSVVKDPMNAVSFCYVDMTMVIKCNSFDVARMWPVNGDTNVRIQLVAPEVLEERIKYLANLRGVAV